MTAVNVTESTYAITTAAGDRVLVPQESVSVVTAGTQGPQGAAGATGPAGPNTVTGSTTTNLTGYLKGNGSAVSAQATPIPVADGGTGTATPALVAGSNVTITGTWPNQTIAATGGSPGGSSGQVQFNNAGSFGADSGLTWDNATKQLHVSGAGGARFSGVITETAAPSSPGVYLGLVGGTYRTVYKDTSSNVSQIDQSTNTMRHIVNGSVRMTVGERSGHGGGVSFEKCVIGDQISSLQGLIRNYILTNNTSVVGQVIQAASGQTANLSEWRNSAGSTLSVIDSAGRLGVGTATPTGVFHFSGVYGSLIYENVTNSNGITFYSAAGTSQLWIVGNNNLNTSNIGFFTSQLNIGNSSQLQVANSGGTTAVAASASTVPLISRGAASQTANLQEWRNSAGTVLASVSAAGGGYFTAPFTINHGLFAGAGLEVITVNGPSDSQTAIRHRQATGNYGTVFDQHGNCIFYQNARFASTGGMGPSFWYGSASAGSGNENHLRIIPTSTTAADATIDYLALRYAGSNYPKMRWSATGYTFNSGGGSGWPSGNGVPYGTATLTETGVGDWMFTALTSSTTPLRVRGAASQTADIQQWQNSAGTALASITGTAQTSGSVDGRLVLYNTNNSSNSGAGLEVWGYNAITSANGPLGKIGFRRWASGSGQHGELAVFIASNGSISSTPSMTFNVNGVLQVPTVIATTGFYTGAVVTGMSYGDSGASLINGFWANSNAYMFGKVNNSTVFSYDYLGQFAAGANITNFPGQITSYCNSAGTIGLVVRAAASQTANLQEWQNSAGTALSYVNAAGRLHSPYIVLLGSTPVVEISPGGNSIRREGANGLVRFQSQSFLGAGWQFDNSSGNVGTVPLSVKAASGQTANLQEWQNGGGSVRAYVDASGTGVFNSAYLTSAGNSIHYAPDSAIGLLVGTAAASNRGLVVRGVASQTGRLTEWQDSAGGVLSAVNAQGRMGIFGAPDSSYSLRVGGSSSILSVGENVFEPFSASLKPLVIKGAASQTANLTEWQNSAGTVLASINASGLATLGSVSADSYIEVRGPNNYRWEANGTNFRLRNVSSGTVVLTADGTTAALTAAGAINCVGADLGAGVLTDFRADNTTNANTTITIGSTDTGRIIETTAATAVSVTLSATATVGTSVTVVQAAAGQCTFASTGSGTVRNRQSQFKTAGQWAIVTMYVRTNAGGSAAEWVLGGDTAA